MDTYKIFAISRFMTSSRLTSYEGIWSRTRGNALDPRRTDSSTRPGTYCRSCPASVSMAFKRSNAIQISHGILQIRKSLISNELGLLWSFPRYCCAVSHRGTIRTDDSLWAFTCHRSFVSGCGTPTDSYQICGTCILCLRGRFGPAGKVGCELPRFRYDVPV